MRKWRFLIGLAIVAAALYIIVGEQLAGTSANAYLNARLTTLRAPIGGVFVMPSRNLGTRIAPDETVGSMQDPLVDDIRLNDLLLELAITRTELERTQTRIADIREAITLLTRQSDDYATSRVRLLEAGLERAQALEAANQARLREADAALQRSRELQGRGIETAANLDRLQAAEQVAARELDASRDTLTMLEIELEAARRGTFLGDSYNDAPYSEQRIQELQLQIDELRAEGDEKRLRIEALQQRINAERLRVNRLRAADIVSPADGLLWNVLVQSGEVVARAQDLVRLVDCRTSVITASVAESIYNRLSLGDAAEFRMTGDDRVFSATITRLAGAGAQTVYENMAVAPGEQHLERYDVTLLSPALRDDPELGCAIGRTGRVFFSQRPLDYLRRLWN